MVTLIFLITTISIAMLLIGFFEIKIPFLFSDLVVRFRYSRKKVNKHARKMIRKKLWYHRIHKGFIDLPV